MSYQEKTDTVKQKIQKPAEKLQAEMNIGKGIVDKKLQQIEGYNGTYNEEGQGELFAKGPK